MRLEAKYLHPLVADWLEQHGYSYEHEVKMRESGKADFVATDPSGAILIIECKLKLDNTTRRTLVQVTDYCQQYGRSAKPALAAPRYDITAYARKLCATYDVLLIEVEGDKEILFQSIYDSHLSVLRRSFLSLELGNLLGVKGRKATEFACEQIYQAITSYTQDNVSFLLRCGWSFEKAQRETLDDLYTVAGNRIDRRVIDTLFRKALNLPLLPNDSIKAPRMATFSRAVKLQNALVSEWQVRGVRQESELSLLTSRIYEAIFDLAPNQYKKLEKFGDEEPYNHMTSMELALVILSIVATTEITQSMDAQGFDECGVAADKGGKVAGDARRQLEQITGNKVVSPNNFLQSGQESKRLNPPAE